MKNPIIYGISLCLLIITVALPSYAVDFGGFVTTGIESVTNDVDNETVTSMSWNNYLNLRLGSIGVRELSFYGYGRYNVGIQDDESFGDLYLGYLEYRTFQGATDIMLGRFDLMTNRFMTLDGISVTQVLPWYFGVSVYAGVPRYKDAEDNSDEFRMTGAMGYGGRVFLSGIDSLQLNVNFYNESGDDDNGSNVVYRRTVGVGGAYYKNFGTTTEPKSITAEALLDNDIENSVIQRMSGRVAGQYKDLQLALFADKYDVQDQYPEKRELIIRMISEGKETRYGVNASYDLFKWLNIYAGITLTDVTMRGDVSNDGSIVRAGADLMLVQQCGIVAGFEFYNYDSVLETAAGIVASVDWQFARDFALYVAYENAWIREGSVDRDAYSVEGRLSMYLTESIITSAMVQVGDSDNEYVDSLRWGVQVKYAF